MSALAATWFDGRSSRARPAQLSSPAAGTLRLESEGDLLEFAAAEIELSPRLGRMARTLRLPGEGHLQVEDSPLLDQWISGRNRIEGWADWLERRRSAAIGAGVATVVGVVLFIQVGLPWMANKVAPVVPHAIEVQISQQAMSLIDRMHVQPSKLPLERQQDLQRQFTTMIDGLPRADQFKLGFRSAPKLGPNAFALPDGQIIVTDELVALAKTDEEILAVLAHEAGHHEHRHGMRRALESSAVVVVAGFLFGDLSGTGSLSVSIPVLLLESGFSRTHEREADGFAFALLKRRGRLPAAFATMMDRLSKHHGESDLGPISYLSSHPASAERIEAANRAAENKD